jgi:hypothetical protein
LRAVLCGRQCSVAGTAPLLTACSVSASRGQSSVAGSASCRQCAVAGSALLQAVRCRHAALCAGTAQTVGVSTCTCQAAQLCVQAQYLYAPELRSSVCRHSSNSRRQYLYQCTSFGVSTCTFVPACAPYRRGDPWRFDSHVARVRAQYES